MTPTQQKALIAYRDRGVTIETSMRARLIRDGYLTEDGAVLKQPEDADTSTKGERIEALFATGKTVAEVAAIMEMPANKIYKHRKARNITGTLVKKLPPRETLRQTGIHIGTLDDFLASNPDAEAIIAHAARRRLTFFGAAGEILSGNSKPHPVFRRSVRL